MQALEKIPLTDDCREFLSTFEYAAIGMALVSPHRHFLQVNPTLCQMLGYSETELLQRSVPSITADDDLDIDLLQVDRLLTGKIKEYQTKKRYLHKQGKIIHAQLSMSLIRDDQHNPLYFIFQIQDISPQVMALQELNVTTARLNTLVDQLPIGVLLADEHRLVRLANQRFCDLLRLPRSPAEIENENSMTLIEDSAHLLARPEYALNRVDEIIRNRRPVHGETLEMSDGTSLRRDYLPVFVDDEYRGNLWTLRETAGDDNRR